MTTKPDPTLLDTVEKTMPDHSAPNWQPISALPLIAKMIDEALDDGRTQLQNLDDARSRPHVLDDTLVNHIIRVYSDQAKFVPVYQEQLERWERLDLTSNQRCEVERSKTQVTSLRNMLLSLLSLAREFKTGSIDAILSKVRWTPLARPKFDDSSLLFR